MEMDIMAIIQQYANIPVVVACFLVGWMLKNVWEAFPNKFIPLVVLPVGIGGVLWQNGWALTPEHVMTGLCSAAVAVYLHQIGKHLIADKSDAEGAE